MSAAEAKAAAIEEQDPLAHVERMQMQKDEEEDHKRRAAAFMDSMSPGSHLRANEALTRQVRESEAQVAAIEKE